MVALKRFFLSIAAFMAMAAPAHAAVRISDMSAASALTGLELFECVQSAASRKCTTALIVDLVESELAIGTMASQDAGSVAITGGTINGASIGASTPATGSFTNLNVTSTSLPANGLSLAAANTLSFAINSTEELRLTASAMSPFANAGLALGSTTRGYNGLHLGTATAINWSNGEVTLTAAADSLTLAGGDFSIGTTAVLTAGTIELGAATDTTIARSGAGSITVEGNAVYRAAGTDVALGDGGTGASLTDPNADRILFWDDSAGATTFLEAGSGLSIAGTTITATGTATTANQKQIFPTGTQYTVTATSAAVDFGTTDPIVTLDAAGTYLLIACARYEYSGATFAASRTITFQINRTNNTPGLINGSARMFYNTPIITTQTYTAWTPCFNYIYTTANSDDILQLFTDVSVLPSAGSLTVNSATSLTAYRLQQ